MRPLNKKKKLGVNGIQVTFHNGTSVVTNGYIVRQAGTNTFICTADGILKKKVKLAWNATLAAAPTAGYCTIPISTTGMPTPTGGTFAFHYEIDTVTVASGGTGYAVGNVLSMSPGGATFTVATVTGGVINTLTPTGRGDTTTMPSVTGRATTGGNNSATVNVTYRVKSITASGGSGYAVGDVLSFTVNGAGTAPTASVSSTSAGAVTGVAVTAPGGSGLVNPLVVASTAGEVEHVKRIWSKRLVTVEGSRYKYKLGGTTASGTVALTAHP